MAISLIQDAQSRNLAAALAGMKREEIDSSISLSPPMSANTSASSNVAIYPGLQQVAAASAFGMLSSPQFLAANRQAAAAFMAAQLPMSTLANTFFPHHPALFGSWAAASQPPTQATHLHSPPASPPTTNTTPLSTAINSNKHPLTSPTSHAGHNEPLKKTRKLNNKKEFQSTNNHNNNHTNNNNNNNNNNTNNNNNSTNNNNITSKNNHTSKNTHNSSASGIELSMSVNDLYNSSNGPISPPSSGSSPNSTHEGQIGTSAAGSKDPSRDKSFTCKTCSRSFGYKHVLQNHERTHTGEKPFECPECHKRFTRDHHLKTHMRLHTGEKPYHCSHCDRQFVQVANLRRHLRVHTGERPYTCEICDGKFSDSNQLKSHMLVHNGEKPFECDRCHMKFRRRHHHLNHKCGIQSPPTPAISPAISGDFPLGENNTSKYTLSSSYCSEESIDLGKPGALLLNHISTTDSAADEEDVPLDLSEDCASSVDGNCSSLTHGRGRKNQDVRRIFRLPPPQIIHVPSEIPEQTEPEDLSMHSPRPTGHCGQSSPVSFSTSSSLHLLAHDDFILDELEDAAAMYLRQQQQLATAAVLKRTMNIA